MNKIKILLIISAIAVLGVLLCACNNNTPDLTETKGTEPEATVTESVEDNATEASADAEDGTVSETHVITEDDNDLEIITVPQNTETVETQTDSAPLISDAEPEPETTAENTTEVQKIELPFVPAN